MKKKFTYFVAAACAALTFSACSSDKLEAYSGQTLENPESPSNAVSFGMYMGKTGTTRAGYAGPITTSNLQSAKTGDGLTHGFGVFAYNTGTTDYASSTLPNFMYNQQVYYSGGWTYEPLKFWPNTSDAGNTKDNPSNSATQVSSDQKLSFFAYAPYVESTPASGEVTSSVFGITGLTNNTTASDPIVTYKFKAKESPENGYDIGTSNNIDLLWGVRGSSAYSEADGTANTVDLTTGDKYNVNLTKQTVDEKVNFLFKHALAKFGGYEGTHSGLKVVADIDANSTTPTTTGIGTKPAETLITLKSIKIENTGTGDGDFVIGGKFNLATGAWLTTDQVKGQISYEYTTSTTSKNENVWDVTAPAYNTGSSAWTNPNGGVLSSEIRDVFSSATDALYFIPGTSPKFKITVEYVVRTYDANIAQNSAINDNEGTWTKVTQKISNIVDFGELKANHFYTLIIHLGLTSVKFAAEVSGWDDTTGSPAADDKEVIWLPSNVVETTAVTIPAATATTNVSAKASTTSYTINMTGLTEGNTVTVAGSGSGYNSAGSVTYTSGTAVQADGLASVVITLNANDSSDDTQAATITLTEKNGESTVNTMSVNITQSKKVD